MLAEHELPGTARHDPLAYLQNRTVDWLDHQLAARELLPLDVANTPLIVEHEYPKARIQDRERLKPILQGSIAFVRRIDEAAASMVALQHEVLAAQSIPVQGTGREAYRTLVPLYLGLDSSTQSLTAIVIDVEGNRREVVFQSSLQFDAALPQYGTRHGVLPHGNPSIAHSPPAMWVDALDIMLGRVRSSGLDLSRLAAISGSAQQHGSVYIAAPDTSPRPPDRPPFTLSRAVAPIWMDSSTSVECAEITAAVGGADVLAGHTGSRAFERFTGPQIRKFFKTEPAAYAATERIHLVSSFLASLLVGAHAPIDPATDRA